MKKWSSHGLNLILAVITGLLTTATIIIQIAAAQKPLTQLEATLFSVLQFVFSLAFAWILARASSRREFDESQRKFAVAAYRRICEIDMATTRLIGRIQSRLPDATDTLSAELSVLLAVALGIRATARSSIADWADVIGDEIATMQRIEELQEEQQELLQSKSAEVTSSSSRDVQMMTSRVEALETKLGDLTKRLPPSLKVLAKSRPIVEDPSIQVERELHERVKKVGYLELEGFWEPDNGFERSISEFQPGTPLKVKIKDAGSRIATLMLCDASGRSIGVIINTASAKYSDFSAGLTGFLRSSDFPVSLVNIEARNKDSKRVYFTVNVHGQMVPQIFKGKVFDHYFKPGES